MSGGHEYDEDGCCIHCGFDGAEWHWWKNNTYEGRALAGPECEPEDRIKEPPCKRERNTAEIGDYGRCMLLRRLIKRHVA